MALFSILPDNLSAFETWTTRIFLFLAILTIGPWAALLIYDVFLYIWRALAYEIPVVGGRARGKARPRAPSLVARPNGHRRSFSIGRPSSRGNNSPASFSGTNRPDLSDVKLRQLHEEYEDSSSST
ncbi:hypothetical protein BU16DRAFT_556856 [Lophium mytilinum]|uniref:Uncharacterized protein n=1 Tax=Lophium mytilinum TaxID=390894 RepID=A0A6A6R6J7_9PEZI|nr:hypothetical protein BU16DRAFT_556856 [Lophium mytilinum]